MCMELTCIFITYIGSCVATCLLSQRYTLQSNMGIFPSTYCLKYFLWFHIGLILTYYQMSVEMLA